MKTQLNLAGEVALELLTEGDLFIGWGKVVVGGIALRSPRIPWRVHLDTPDGGHYDRFEVESIAGDPTERRIRLRAHGHYGLRGDLCDDYDADLWFPGVRAPFRDTLTWVLRPCQLDIGGDSFSGFSYALEFESAGRSIYRITIESTWELGESIEGVTHLHQGQCNPPVYVGSRDTSFTTSVLKSLGRPWEGEQGWGNQSMQTTARHGSMQCFDFQYSPRGALIGLWERGEYVRSLIQKNNGEDVLFVVDEHHVPYGRTARTAPKIMALAPIYDPSQAHDAWLAVRDFVAAGFERQWSFEAPPPRPEAQINESWFGAGSGAPCWFGGRALASRDLLHVLADEWLPQIKARGLLWAGFFPLAQSDFTELGQMRKLDQGIHGDLHVGSVCCVHRYSPADHYGGMAAWRYYADCAHSLGLKVGLWVGNNISAHAPVLAQHPEWFNLGRNGRTNMGGYTGSIGATVNWNSGFRDWLLADLCRWREEGGLDYIFIDSWGNLGLLPIHFNDGFSNNLDGLGNLMRELREIGIEHVSNEGMGPFCPPRFGLSTHQTMAEGQNSLRWWLGNEDMASGLMPCIPPLDGASEAQAHESYFRFFANGAVPQVGGWPETPPEALRATCGDWLGTQGKQLPWFYEALSALDPVVRESMWRRRRQSLPQGRGVLWTGGPRDLLWSYRSFPFEMPPGTRARQIYPLDRDVAGAVLTTEPLAVYQFEKAAAS